MEIDDLNKTQKDIVLAPINSKIFIEGPFGSGKTTTGVARLNFLIQNGIPAQSILVFIPQRTLAKPFIQYTHSQSFPPGGFPTIITFSGLAQRTIALFWPIVAEKIGFQSPTSPPKFLNIETSQYFMAQVTKEYFDRGYFLGIYIDRNRLLNQILDNLNKAALVGYPFTNTAERLKSAWTGEPGQKNIYDQAQECAIAFRSFCLKNNLLDYSLQIEIFNKYLWHEEPCRKYLIQNYRHLIVDNLEEDVPIFHDFLMDFLPQFKSALLLYDDHGGFRTFLGADPISAIRLKALCKKTFQFIEPLNFSNSVYSFKTVLLESIDYKRIANLSPNLKKAFTYQDCRFYPQMIQEVCNKTRTLINEKNISANEIVILAPYLSDALRFLLISKLQSLNIPAFSSRPSRTLHDEPAIRCCLTLAKIANPQWSLSNTQYDIRNTLLVAIPDIDIIRADLIAKTLAQSEGELKSFDSLLPAMQTRISFRIGEKYERIRNWIDTYKSENPMPLDIFISKLFGELLSQPGFGFHKNIDAASQVSQLIASIKEFRKLYSQSDKFDIYTMGSEYIQTLEKGLIASQYIPSFKKPPQNAVLIAPAFTYLMSNRSVEIQFWLDISNIGWWVRLDQPLTHPYVLSRQWKIGNKWTDAYEFSANQESLKRLMGGLLVRCKNHIYLYSTGINESGNEQRGPLLRAFQTLLKQFYKMEKTADV